MLSGCCGAAASAAVGRAKAATAEPRLFQGCLLTPEGYRQYRAQRESVHLISEGLMSRNRHWHTTGDPALDRDLDRALAKVADLFGVNPAFGFYDPSRLRNPVGFEQNGMNAFASDENTDIPGTRGTVGFGWDLFHREFYEFDPTGLTVMGIVAHEFAHVLQQDRRLLPALRTGTPLKSEMHADYLAGYFLGARKRQIPSLQFRKAGELFMRMGEPGNGDPNRDHGNSLERLDAAEAGFRIAYVENKPLDDAVRAGLEYVSF